MHCLYFCLSPSGMHKAFKACLLPWGFYLKSDMKRSLVSLRKSLALFAPVNKLIFYVNFLRVKSLYVESKLPPINCLSTLSKLYSCDIYKKLCKSFVNICFVWITQSPKHGWCLLHDLYIRDLTVFGKKCSIGLHGLTY